MSDPAGPFRPGELYRDRTVFILGGTGFLGKVTAALLLDRYPDVRRVFLMVRSAGSGGDSENRFWTSTARSEPFRPLREKYGEGFEAFMKEKITVVDGDVTSPGLGLAPELSARIAAECDLVINCSGKVDFNPPLESSLRVNVTGTKHTLEFVRTMRTPAYVHTSTCFVAGNRSGEIPEDEPLAGYFPNRGKEGWPAFDPDEEILWCERLSVRVREEAADRLQEARFREAAVARFREEGRDPDDAAALKLGIARERKNWVRERLSSLGLERARSWGWPNIYTYCKSLGEQLVARETGIAAAILRPAIVESAVAFPFPGWNEGFNTSGPFVHAAVRRGQPIVPSSGDHVLDLIPVDYVAAAVLLSGAHCLEGAPWLAYQASTGDRNPLTMDRITTLLGLYKRKSFQSRERGHKLVNEVVARMESRVTDPAIHEKYIQPALEKVTKRLTEELADLPRKAPGAARPLLRSARDAAVEADDFARFGGELFHTFKPFVVENDYRFRSDHLHALCARMTPDERARLPYAPQTIDWYDYLLHVHFPGLERWVFPKLEEERRPETTSRKVHAHANLVELFDAATKLHAARTAMRITRDGREETYAYADLRECTLRAAAFLAGAGVAPGDRVGLIAENGPEWGMTYFGILKAGATAIPLEKDAATAEIAALLTAGEARGIVLSPALARRHAAGLRERLAGVVSLWTFDDVYAVRDEAAETAAIAKLPPAPRPEALASIIFTSGTTGNPKGVMLTHRNFASLVARLLTVVEFTPEDGMLSVLPLHHSFEFTAGMLCPLARGASITYLAKLSEESIKDALATGHITVIIGVPALWKMLKRGIDRKLEEKSRLAKRAAELLMDAVYHLREETGLNIGPAVFWPVHEAFGGRVRYMISGGAALPADIAKAFRGLGFDLLEGYGLTESAPVLTVTRPDPLPVLGSVGTPLPGIELKLVDPDRRGVGEVAARGPNIMAGYYKNPDATAQVLRDGWLYTGDLGRLDEKGHLTLVGRAKDVIIGFNGKNVYPDELEETYANPDLIKELSIVGLPDGRGGERVACLAVPAEAAGDREAAERRIREHFAAVSGGLPVHKRVRFLQCTDTELPRTATKKVKRREVQTTLARLAADDRRGAAADGAATESGGTRAAPGGARAGGEGAPQAEPLELPAEARRAGGALLDAGQALAFSAYFNTTVRGREYIPDHVNYLVAANHASHLDMGLIKIALGDAGPELVTLAATDYFFDHPVKRDFFLNFTRIVPLDRQGNPRKSYLTTIEQLREGRSVLIFPEGSRTRTGALAPFQRGLGFLALKANVGILPMYVDTFSALPPGRIVPKGRDVEARIGPFQSSGFLTRLIAGLGAGESERLIAAHVQSVVEALRDGAKPRTDVDAVRAWWTAEGSPRHRQPVTSAGTAEEDAA